MMLQITSSDEKKGSPTETSVDVGVGGGILIEDGVVYDNEHEISRRP